MNSVAPNGVASNGVAPNGVALVTGGRRGIGLAVAVALAGAGFRVAILDHCAPDGPDVRDALERLGPESRYIRHDMARTDDIPRVVDKVEAELGPVTTLVNNAGVGPVVRGDMLELAPENFDRVMDVNLRGALFLTQAVARRMIEHRADAYRSISFVTSISATHAATERAGYCISKAAASMMSTLFALRLAPHGIGVFEFRPGIIATDMTRAVSEAYTTRIEDGLVPAGRWGEPRDIADAIVPCATGLLRFSTGAVIPVDGGLSIPHF